MKIWRDGKENIPWYEHEFMVPEVENVLTKARKEELTAQIEKAVKLHVDGRISLWLDDWRKMPITFDVQAFTADEAIFVLESGTVGHISLDHDLQEAGCYEKNGYTVARTIEEMAYMGTLKRMTWACHSANPSGTERMRAAMKSADRYWKDWDDDPKGMKKMAVKYPFGDCLLYGVHTK